MQTTKPVRKAVIPVAGNGTRFLPATKAMPKEMLTIVNRPVIQYAVEEALAAGIEHIVFVTSRNKSAIEDHFDAKPELVSSLRRAGKDAQADLLDAMLPKAGCISYTRQQEPLGLGHAVWCARDVIGREPFALLLPDMVCFGEKGCTAGLVDLYQETGGNVVGVETCAPQDVSKYGIVGRGRDVEHGFAVTAMVEKPRTSEAPSNFYLNGRYILQPEIFDLLEGQRAGVGGEIQLTDAMLGLSRSQAFHAHPYQGQTFDCGSKEGFVAANMTFALASDDIGETLHGIMKELVMSREGASKAA